MKILLDNSAFSTLSCRRQFQLTVLHGLYSPPSEALSIGSIVHTALEHMDHGRSLEETGEILRAQYQTIPPKALTAITMLAISGKLFEHPVVNIGETQGIEYKLCYHYGRYVTERNTEYEVYLAATLDRIYMDGNILVIRDYKTAQNVKDYSCKEKIRSYDMAFQLPFYVYALLKSNLLSEEQAACIKEHRYRTEHVLIFYNAQPARVHIEPHPAFSDTFLYQEIPDIIAAKVADAIKIAGYQDTPAPKDGMTVYKACEFCQYRPACLKAGSAYETEYLDRFSRRDYNPLTFR